jgi:quinol monooxygenase YgiN
MSNTEIIRHVLLGRFRPETTPDKIQLFADTFRELTGKIEGILSFEYGENHSREGLNHDYTHVYILTFENEQALDAYLPHPEHRQFVEWMVGLAIIQDLLVIDYKPRS